MAQQEREAIARRTREALMAAKARGTKLGNQNGAAALRRVDEGTSPSQRPSRTKNAEAFARELAPLVEEIRAAGCKACAASLSS